MGTDWRFENLKFLESRTFRFAAYRVPGGDWDHDHCNSCWAKFAEFEGPHILHEGYELQWVCPRCFEEFCEPLGFKLLSCL